jgi:deoxyribodipyrimidine photolyase-related protein
MEHFYRVMRRELDVLLEPDGTPVGGRWNLDADNRESFGRAGPVDVPPHRSFAPDAITRDVIDMLDRCAPELVGSVDGFDWPVTASQAREALDDFVTHRLPRFGDHQDAMWTGQPWLFHARLAPALNLKLLDPRDAVRAAVDAWSAGQAPLNAVEGFVRQVIGWREYVRGLYWWQMPDLIGRNTMGADRALPPLFWSGDTEAACLREVVTQLLETGYAHHIQRLMVTGLFALLYGTDPAEVHDWFMALHVDSVEWVTLPNVVGMSQFADGGVLATKPYVASGQYVRRMSNYCTGCRFDPKQTIGPNACPFSVLYVDYLARHRDALSGNRRMNFQMRNLDRRSPQDLAAIRREAERITAAAAEGRL